MAIDYNKLRGILERKANKAIGYLDELKCFVPEFKEVLDSVLYISETLKDLNFLDTECPDCKKEVPQEKRPERPDLRQEEEKLIGQDYNRLDPDIEGSDFAVLFYSDGCEPCQKMKPVVLEVSKELGVQLEMVSVDGDIGVSHALDYGIKGWPRILVIKDNKIVHQVIGYNMQLPAEEVKADLKNAFRHFLEL